MKCPKNPFVFLLCLLLCLSFLAPAAVRAEDAADEEFFLEEGEETLFADEPEIIFDEEDDVPVPSEEPEETGTVEPANAAVSINAANFPDAIFRQYIIDNFDNNPKDDSLSDSEIAAVKNIIINDMGISKVDGVNFFTSLERLECGNNNITDLDVSKLSKLRVLVYSDNPMTGKVTLSDTIRKNLVMFDCSHCGYPIDPNQFSSLVWYSSIGNSEILGDTKMNITNCPNLENLYLDSNGLKALDVTACPKLEVLFCTNNKLTSLNVSKCPDLKALLCGGNKLTSLNLSKNDKLYQLFCWGNPDMKALDLTESSLLCKIVTLTAREEGENGGCDVYYYRFSYEQVICVDKALSLSPDTYHFEKPVLSSITNKKTGIEITWQEIPYSMLFNIYRRTDTEGWQSLGRTTGNDYLDTTAVSGTKYYYRIRALAPDNSVASKYSKALSITRLAGPPLKVYNKTDGVKIKWDKVKGADKYIVYRKKGSGKYQVIETTSSLSCLDKTAKNGTKYTYRVIPYKKSDKGAPSASLNIRFVSTPVIESATAKTGKNVIKWKEVPKASGYIIYRQGPDDSGWVAIGSRTTLTIYDKKVESGVKYKYTVRAMDSSGKYISDYAASKKVTAK